MQNAAPLTLGQMADSYYTARAARLEQGKILEDLKSKETVAERMLIDALRAQGLEGAKGQTAVAAIKRNDTLIMDKDDDGEPVGKDEFVQFLLDTRDVSLLQFRPSLTRVKELMGEGVEVPGVRIVEVESISLTKVKKSA